MYGITFMRVAAYQASLEACSTMDVLPLIREQVGRCESEGVEILCCPEAALGGLADYVSDPASIALSAEGGQLDEVLAPLASNTVTTIVGFTEIDSQGRLFNSAAVFHRGSIIGVYRKHHPAINRSVYAAGDRIPLFKVGDLSFGIIICRDSTHTEPAKGMVLRGAAALFVPTNNGLPPAKAGPELVAETRTLDIARARDSRVSVIRSDVVGSAASLSSYGSSGIVDPNGVVLAAPLPGGVELLIAEIETAP
jgi:5-aminopentanamidase